MIVNRRIFNFIPGNEEKIIENLKKVGAEFRWPGNVRVYTTYTGTFNTLVFEFEFESMAEYEAAWDAWANSKTADWFGSFWQGVELPGGSNELYRMAFTIDKP